MGLDGAVQIIAATPDEAFIIASPEDSLDRLTMDLEVRYKWRYCWDSFTHWQHGGVHGWRAKGNWGLHVVKLESFTYSGETRYDVYSAHIDPWSPGGMLHPVSCAAHLTLDFLFHKITHSTPSQERIARALAKKEMAHQGQ